MLARGSMKLVSFLELTSNIEANHHYYCNHYNVGFLFIYFFLFSINSITYYSTVTD